MTSKPTTSKSGGKKPASTPASPALSTSSLPRSGRPTTKTEPSGRDASTLSGRAPSSGPTKGPVSLTTRPSPVPIPMRESPPFFTSSVASGSASSLLLSEITPGPKKKLPPVTLVYEGRGGTFYYGPDVNQKYLEHQKKLAGIRDITNKSIPGEKTTDYFLLTNAIGTEGLVSCVGLFFRIGTDRLFFAHMDICVEGFGRSHELTLWEAGKIARAVYGKLLNVAGKQGWKKEEVDKESVTVVCPKISAGPKTDAAAQSVRDGVCLFLNIERTEAQMKPWGGFVVEGGRLTKTLDELQPMDGFSNSPHSNTPSPNVWRYMVGKGWNVSAGETVKGI